MKKNKRNMQLLLKLKIIFKIFLKKDEDLNIKSKNQITALQENLDKIEEGLNQL